MADTELRKLKRIYSADPTRENLFKLRKVQLRAGITPEPVQEKVFLEYGEYRTGGEPDDPDDEWTSHSDQYVEFTPTSLGLTQSKKHWRNETINIDFLPQVGQEVTLVVVRYETGSTFGRIIGVWQMIGVFEDRQKVDNIRGLISKFNSGECKGINKKMAKLTGQGHFSPDWVGYFERFIETETHTMTLVD